MDNAYSSAGPAFIHHGPDTRLAGAPVVLGLPAMGTPARYYEPFARRLAELAGASVAWAELRGQGESRPRARDGADFGYREIVEDDIPRLAGRLLRQHPRRPLVLLGHSLGGQLATLAAHQLGEHLAGLVLVAAGTAHHRAWPRGARWRAALAVHGIRATAAMLPWYPGHRLGFGGEQPRRFMRDWSRNATTGRYRIEGSEIDHEDAAGRLALPVLSLAIRQDPVAPPGAVEELLAKLARARIERRWLMGVVRDPPWKRHFSWAREPAGEMAAAVARWLHALPAAAALSFQPAPAPAPEGERHVLV
ncbi:alpha/beta fold hydrolase [Caldimonas sp. KR1-144]|uniref:alpha/beta hydrolase family protein n=1 Tax=Caldimonas sp. KR1-144 TaxID=3400911 RepID=UPI003C007962